ncbi:MAG: anhydro-N-acetylmuramic acid kinase [Rickettsiales bacterium]
MAAERKWSLGLMSGTSLDGVDAALIRTDGEHVFEFGESITINYNDQERKELREAVYGRGDILLAEHKMTIKHADVVANLLKKTGLSYRDIEIIGFHGQTVSHRPDEHLTWQIGDGALLAEKTRIDVVSDFRRRDVAAGGQGAPLVPLYHAALARRMNLPVAILNIGGMANVTWIGRSENAADELMALDILAFDTGTGNVLLNEWAFEKTSQNCDLNGALAFAGEVSHKVVELMLKDWFFAKHPPKSLDRNYFTFEEVIKLSPEDGAATLTEFTTASIELGAKFFPAPARQWFVAGGGRLNPAIMESLREKFNNVYPVESLGWKGDALEAQAFAFLAVRSLKGLPLSLPTTTGAIRAVTGGTLHRA